MPNRRRRWRNNSIFGDGPRVPLDREQRAQFRAKLHLNRRPGRLTIATAQIGRILVDMLGPDGRLDPCHLTLAARAGVALATVKRALDQLRALGFLEWTRRLVRCGPRCEQISNAYVLRVPACEAHFARAAVSNRFKKEEAQERLVEETLRAGLPDLLAARRKVMEARMRERMGIRRFV